MKKTTIYYFFAATLFIAFASCGGGVEEEILPEYDRSDSISTDYLRELGNIRVSIEQTAKLNQALFESGYSYNSSVMTTASKSYSSSMQQAIGLGAFGADMSYATVNEQPSDAMNYVKGIKTVADKLGIGSAFSKDMLSKMTETDSTINKSILLTKAYLRAEDQLHNEERSALASLMSVGGWVEGLYISTSIAKAKEPSDEISAGIWSQAYSFTNIMAMLKVFKESNVDCAEVIKMLEEAEPAVNEVIQKGDLTKVDIVLLNEAIVALRGKLLN